MTLKYLELILKDIPQETRSINLISSFILLRNTILKIKCGSYNSVGDLTLYTPYRRLLNESTTIELIDCCKFELMSFLNVIRLHIFSWSEDASFGIFPKMNLTAIESQIGLLTSQLQKVEAYLQKPLREWTEDEKEEFGDKGQLRKKEEQLRELLILKEKEKQQLQQGIGMGG